MSQSEETKQRTPGEDLSSSSSNSSSLFEAQSPNNEGNASNASADSRQFQIEADDGDASAPSSLVPARVSSSEMGDQKTDQCFQVQDKLHVDTENQLSYLFENKYTVKGGTTAVSHDASQTELSQETTEPRDLRSIEHENENSLKSNQNVHSTYRSEGPFDHNAQARNAEDSTMNACTNASETVVEVDMPNPVLAQVASQMDERDFDQRFQEQLALERELATRLNQLQDRSHLVEGLPVVCPEEEIPFRSIAKEPTDIESSDLQQNDISNIEHSEISPESMRVAAALPAEDVAQEARSQYLSRRRQGVLTITTAIAFVAIPLIFGLLVGWIVFKIHSNSNA